MAANTKVRGVTIDQLLANLLNGVNAVFPSGSSLVINGIKYDKAGLVQKLQEVIQPFLTVSDLQLKTAVALQVRDQSEQSAETFANKLIACLSAEFVDDPAALVKCGLKAPRQKRQLSAQEEAAKVAKAAATRKLRNTMGSRQKEDVKATGAATVTVTLPPNGSTASTGSIPAPTPAPVSPPAASSGADGQQVNGAGH